MFVLLIGYDLFIPSYGYLTFISLAQLKAYHDSHYLLNPDV